VYPITLHGQPIETVFDLLGKHENDLTYSLGWGMGNSQKLASALMQDVASELGTPPPEEDFSILLQEHIPQSGYTDVEIRSSNFTLIIEAKRGWEIPSNAQLEKYARSMLPGIGRAILILAEGSPSFADGRFPSSVPGSGDQPVSVVYRSWQQLTELAQRLSGGPSTESQLLRQLARYLRGLVNMRNVRDNMVYVVALGHDGNGWSPISPRDIVLKHDRYFHPVEGSKGGWPKEPPNYFGFRFDGRLQQIRHVDDVEVTQRPRDFIPGFTATYDFDKPHYMYSLGPAIEPPLVVKNGKVTRALRVWAAIDLLLTCETISEARDRTAERQVAT